MVFWMQRFKSFMFTVRHSFIETHLPIILSSLNCHGCRVKRLLLLLYQSIGAGDDNSSIQIGVRASQNATEFCGLCGSRSGELLKLDGSVADRTDMAQRKDFARSYEVDPRDQILRLQRRECGKCKGNSLHSC